MIEKDKNFRLYVEIVIPAESAWWARHAFDMMGVEESDDITELTLMKIVDEGYVEEDEENNDS